MRGWRRGVRGLIGLLFTLAAFAWSADELPPGVMRGRPSAAVVQELLPLTTAAQADKTVLQRLGWELAFSTVTTGEDVKALFGLLADPKWQKEQIVIRLITRAQDRQLAESFREAHAVATSSFQRALALTVLGRVGDQTDVPRAREALRANDLLEREAAVECLAGLGATEVVAELVDLVADGKILPVRVARFGRPAVAEALRRLSGLTTGPIDTVPTNLQSQAKAYLLIIMLSHDHEAHDVQEACLKSPNPDVQEAVAMSFGHCDHPEASPVCLSMLTHANFAVRYYAAAALGRMKDRSAIPFLLARLTDASFSVRAAAAEALGELQAREAIPALEKMAKEDAFNQETARRVLERLRQ